jgi:L-amino acid N-acyltransferase YncA
MIKIRKVIAEDSDAIWEIFHLVVKNGDTYPFDPETGRDDFPHLWLATYMHTYVVERDGEIVGTYVLKPNMPGLGAHVANGSYMVHPSARGQGIGRAMCTHSLSEARALGFKAMQFNLVVSTNIAAVELWKTMGFWVVGTLPKAFKHRSLGYVDAYVMYQNLDAP